MMRPGFRRLSGAVLFLLAATAIIVSAGQRPAPPASAGPPALAPIDPQRVQDQQDMTWSDYHPIPGVDWASPSLTPRRVLRVALVAIDFDDQPFVITQPKKSDLFGNPQVDPIARADVPKFYADFLDTPSAVNHGHTINGYWMEQSRGGVGIPKVVPYGPYKMPKRLFQYGLNEYGQAGACPGGFTCDGRMEPDADALWLADAGADVKSKYDIVIRIYAGYDETSVWQEFGEMKFKSKDDIPAAWGNPDTTKPRWVITRYEPWTSWKAGQMQWGLSSVRQGESSGTITHEIAHFAFRVGDNNNNPYVTPYRRVGSGPWDIMDRGSFNGPGGPHSRWMVPATAGASMPAGFMLRSRLLFGFVTADQVLKLNRNALAQSGLVIATIVARAVEPGAGELAGIQVKLDGAAPQDRTPACDRTTNPLCAGDPVFNDYTVEVVQRIGYDSFTPDNGVLIAKNKDREGNSCGYSCFTWVVDAHPEDIDQLDFTRPDGTRVMRTIADYRQLNDALFHAGLDSGSQYEWEDTANRLHFYVIDTHRDTRGIVSYTIGVRSLDDTRSATHGVTATGPATFNPTTSSTMMNVTIRNTGVAAARTSVGLHPADTSAYANSDIYRVSAVVTGRGWTVDLSNALVALKFGGSTTIPVRVVRAAAGASPATLTLTAVSESDPAKKATVTTMVSSK